MKDRWIDTRVKLPDRDNMEVWFVVEVPRDEYRAAIHGVFLYSADTARGRTTDAAFANHVTGAPFPVARVTHWQPFFRPAPPEGQREPRAHPNNYTVPGPLRVPLKDMINRRPR